MPRIKDYPLAGTLQDTDAFVIDREDVGTMYIQGLAITNSGGRCITYVVDGGGSVIPTGIVGDLYIPFNCNIYAVTLLADQVGSVVVDIWRDLLTNYPPTIADSIVALAPPTLTSADNSQDTVLTGWTRQIAANSTLRFNINSVTAITRLTIALAVI